MSDTEDVIDQSSTIDVYILLLDVVDTEFTHSRAATL